MNVGVVLLNWNGGEFTIPCIQSLLNGSRVPDKVVIVDNGSTDGSQDKIEVLFPGVCLIKNTFNNGFAGGCNQGIEYLLAQRVDFIWVLNNDTLVDKDCLRIILKTAVEHPSFAGFSGKIFYETPANEVWYAGAYRHPLHMGIKHIHNNDHEKQDTEFLEVEFISGCCMFVHADIWLKYGGFIEKYIAYSEDNEWCWRLSNNNEKFLYIPKAILWHRLSSSVKKNFGKKSGSVSQRTWYLLNRNHLWTVRRHSNCEFKIAALFFNMLIVVKKVIVFIFTMNFMTVKSYLNGSIQGLFSELPVPFKFDNHNSN
jgi:GT2 family glycosyltransferase